jgi:sugar phosphate permease
LGKKQRLLFGTSLATGILFILAGVSPYLPLTLFAIILGGGISLTRRPLMNSYMQKYIPSQKRATIMSGVSMLRTLSIVIANLIIGKLAQWSVTNTFILLGITALVAAFISRVEERHLKE